MESAETEVTVCSERSHSEGLGELQRLTVVHFTSVEVGSIRMPGDIAEQMFGMCGNALLTGRTLKSARYELTRVVGSAKLQTSPTKCAVRAAAGPHTPYSDVPCKPLAPFLQTPDGVLLLSELCENPGTLRNVGGKQ